MTSVTNQDNIRAWSVFSQELIENFGDEGDFSRQHLLNPALFELLGDVKGQRIDTAGAFGMTATFYIRVYLRPSAV